MTARSAAKAGKTTGRRVFFFGAGKADGNAGMKELLGGKGANLAEMTRLGLPVPPGFTISTAVCAEYEKAGGKVPRSLEPDVAKALRRVERIMDARFGDPKRPLLLSVRSGARASMPGMMDTVLNLGLNDRSAEGLAALADARFAYDSYRRFVQMYSDVVLEVPRDHFEHRLEALKASRGVHLDTDLGAEDWRELVREYLRIVEEETGKPFPQDSHAQLWGAIGAVFRSWGNPRAITYRKLNGIPADWGTAVNVQAMVFGNMGDDCATGVAFTRDPSTGANFFYGEYLKNAQGEDVVAGIRTPQPINKESRSPDHAHLPTLEEEMPKAYKELAAIRKKLESHYRDMQDVEFTIQNGKLWMLQTRNGKRTVRAAVTIAVEMAREKLIPREVAVTRVDPGSLDQLLHPTLDPDAEKKVIAKGLPASPGAACGKVVFSADEAEAKAKAGEKVVLVRIETSPEDIHGMYAAEGILTARGGMTSHAAVVARGMGKCCVVGCGTLQISYDRGEIRVNDTLVRAGDVITIDGSSGEVILGEVATVTPELGGEFGELMRWADVSRQLEVRTNADTPHDAKVARDFGAQGIGLCRTEHMFFEEERILAVREMILSTDEVQRGRALEKLLPMQRGDFVGIFQAMDGLPVTIRLLDPPLHEFLPHEDAGIREVAEVLGDDVAAVRARIEERREFNPMLGHRGCRLGITFPDIYRMQVRAITEAACQVAQSGVRVRPEIMIPLIAHVKELARLRQLAEEEVARVLDEHRGVKLKIPIGTMIEVPRAALVAADIARYADFFSFGTNDLTQMTYALSRDDAGKFLPEYLEAGILEDDPFVSIDREGIGQLVMMGVERGRSTRRDLKVGICGEHGGDPKSVQFCAQAGLDYVSCSPFRVPVARLAAAQAAITARGGASPRAKRKPKPRPKAKPAAAGRGSAKRTTRGARR
ncbi:MAG: pyruvate, phosphate dikinase [Proteobacteria bacterium]|nr:MAG: pyruvate, phosphate dikinase [Pseudomonadota bacterium]